MRLDTGSEALRRALAGRLPPPACLITGPAAPARELADRMAAALVCTAPGGPDAVPCLTCSACRRALAGHHPDVILVRTDKKQYPIDQLRRLRADAWVRPTEAERKVYLLTDAQKMAPRTQNVLLKLLEEGPPYAAFLLLADDPAALLPTIRSRCVRFSAAGDGADAPDEAAVAAAEDFFRRLTAGDELQLIAWAAALESGRTGRDEMRAILRALLDLLGDALRQGADGLTKRQLLAVTALTEELLRQCDYNLGAAHCAGRLAAACWEVLHD